MRTLAALLTLVLLGLSASLVSAQDAAVTADIVVAPTEPAVPPVMVAVLASGHVPDDVVAAVSSSLVDAVRPLAGGRPVLPLALPALRDRLAACADAACQGAIVGELGVIGAIVARLSRRGTRGDVAMTLDMIDPVSGASRVPSISASLNDAASAPGVIAPLVESLRAAMFSPPPPPPTLLITVNVDGATILIDDVSVGRSPIASQRLTPGHHMVAITLVGYAAERRALDLEAGQQERLDISLTALDGTTVADDAPATLAGSPRIATPWYEEWYVWVGVGAGVLVITGVIIGAVLASQPTAQPDPMGIPIPGLHF